jgi:hypothetical protein
MQSVGLEAWCFLEVLSRHETLGRCLLLTFDFFLLHIHVLGLRLAPKILPQHSSSTERPYFTIYQCISPSSNMSPVLLYNHSHICISFIRQRYVLPKQAICQQNLSARFPSSRTYIT